MSALPFKVSHTLELREVNDDDLAAAARAASDAGRGQKEDFGTAPGSNEAAGGGGSGSGSGSGSDSDRSMFYEFDDFNLYDGPRRVDGSETITGRAPVAAPKASDEPASPIVYALPLPPVRVKYEYLPSDTVTMTAGGAVHEHALQRAVMVEARFEVGLEHRLGTDEKGAPRFWDAPRLFGALRAFLRYYWKRAADPGRPPVELIWRDFHDNEHLVVKLDAPPSWTYDETHRLAPFYELRLFGYATAKATKASWIEENLGFLRDAVQEYVIDSIDTGALWLEVARTNVSELLGLASDLTLGPIRAIERVLDRFRGLSNELRNARVFGRAVAREAVGLIDSALFSIESVLADLGIDGGQSEGFQSAHEALLEAKAALSAAFTAAWMQNGATRAAHSTYIVKAGDTIQGIASLYYGTGSAWQAIVDANKLVHPYIAAAALPGVAGPGDALVLPGPVAGASSGNVFPVPVEDPDDALFGRDIYRDPVTLGWEPNASGDGLRRVRGEANVVQAVDGRLRTDRGTNVIFPSIGMSPLMGNPNVAGAAALHLSEILEQVEADPRVARVETPAVDDTGAGLGVSIGLRLADGRTVEPFKVGA